MKTVCKYTLQHDQKARSTNSHITCKLLTQRVTITQLGFLTCGIIKALRLQTDPITSQAERTCFMALQEATLNFHGVHGGLDTRFSITLMCWVGGQDGPLVSHGDWGVMVAIEHGKFLNQMIVNFFKLVTTRTTEVLPAGKWVHVVASYDYSSGNTRCISTDILPYLPFTIYYYDLNYTLKMITNPLIAELI